MLAIAVALSACANGYEKFYQPNPVIATASVKPIPFQGEPRVLRGADPKQDLMTMFQDGYTAVGSSSFVGAAQAASGAIGQAKKVGAEIVVLYSKYQSTATGAIPITTPTTQTSYTSGTVNAFGSGGFGTGTYQGTATTYGTQTTYVPFTVDRYDQAAVYYAPLERKGSGVFLVPMTDQQKQQVGTNQGVAVAAVRKESPAFKADILPGDIVFSINGQNIFDMPSATRALIAATGGETEVVLFHGGARITKKFIIPAEW